MLLKVVLQNIIHGCWRRFKDRMQLSFYYPRRFYPTINFCISLVKIDASLRSKIDLENNANCLLDEC